MYSDDELNVLNLLKCYPDQFLSGKEVCRRAGGKRRFQQDPVWALPLLSNLVARKVVESDHQGHFRLAPVGEEKKSHDAARHHAPQADARPETAMPDASQMGVPPS